MCGGVRLLTCSPSRQGDGLFLTVYGRGLGVGNRLAGGREDLGSERRTLTHLLVPAPISLVFLDRDEFNIQVLHAFVGLHEFTDLNLVQALR